MKTLSLILVLVVTVLTQLSLGLKLDFHVQGWLDNDSDTKENIFIFTKKATLTEDKQGHIERLQQSLLNSGVSMSRAVKRTTVYEIRNTIATFSQKELLQILQAKGYKTRSLWINNSIYVYKATKELIRELESRSDIIEIRGTYEIARITPVETLESSSKSTRVVEWNIEHINAPLAWNITKGEGVVVANIDTGVRETHVTLLDNYRGYLGNNQFSHDYNWYDPKEFQNDEWWCGWGCSPADCCLDTPFDPIGHGTHTMGTIAGSEGSGIGVAPGVKWIAAKGCRDGSCLNFGLLTSAEWVICPTKLDGTAPDCTQGADIVSNSWGGGGGDDWYMEVTDAWKEAGIIGTFSQGNSGPKCETAGSPGDYAGVIGVGATNDQDSLADFSSRGPGDNSTAGIAFLKPEISAPGVSIRSASSTVGSSDNEKYSVSSGTSMACPHVTGVIALMLSVNPSLDYDSIVNILGQTANKAVAEPENGRQGSNECNGKNYDDLPSFHYGYGIVDAQKAVQEALKRRV